MKNRNMVFAVASLVLVAAVSASSSAQQPDPATYSSLRWRMIGPFRGGRTVAAVGVPELPGLFYIGVNNGGVWKTTDYGHVWTPIFDHEPTNSIGAIAVAPSNSDIIYVGSGEGLQRPDLSTGDGIYKSTNAGQTWEHLGLRDGQQIGQIIVDPKNPNRLFVAVLGHPYGPNEERGVFRSTDGGKTFQKVLYKDENTGAIELAFDPTDARTVYADLWAARQSPWEAGGSFNGPGSGLFKSTDGGDTWRQLTKGLPTIADGLGRIGFSVSPSNPKRLYAIVDAGKGLGTYRSDDAGESWTLMSTDPRPVSRSGDFAEIRVHPKNPDVAFAANVASYRTTDGGKTWASIKGAPGGDDYHRIWIDPLRPDVMLFASDQGATITVNGGDTWSSWYNQPTAQFYHVITDDRVPYWVYGGQQESGSAAVMSRGDNGAITFRDWRTVGVEEYGYVAPDPLNPNYIYGGKITRFDLSNGEVQHVSPEVARSGKYRFVRTMPVIFSSVDKKTLYLASNVLFRTRTGGDGWDVISPDLTRESYEVPANLGIFTAQDPEKGKHRGVIYAVGPSFLNVNTIWAGTDDGLIHLTRDGGKHWKNVTPPALTPWSKVSQLVASHFDDNTAYAAINRFRLDDLDPHIYRTHDGGATWKEIVTGIPRQEVVNTVREDPVRKGLLFAGTERAVYFSLDDGEHWQTLRLNMPASSIRDLVLHDDDIVVGTHGRSFWILDDMTALRQLTGAAGARLFAPKATYRFRRNKNTDTPLPPEEPAGENPPDGAIINYYLPADARLVTVEILDAAGKKIRQYSSTDVAPPIPADLVPPTYWIRPARIPSAKAGAHRFVWDLHHPPPAANGFGYPISAIIHDTPLEPVGPAVLPGIYTVKLTVDGRAYTQPLTVKIDPRVHMTRAQLALQHSIGVRMLDATQKAAGALEQQGDSTDSVALARVRSQALAVLDIVEGADMPPTSQAIAAADAVDKQLAALLTKRSALKSPVTPLKK
jgi:photosystem II stability/assembly factor-like uncharacterized protein